MWKLLNKLYHLASYTLLFCIILGGTTRLLSLFVYQDAIPFIIELSLAIFSLAFLKKHYHPYDLPGWVKEKK